MKFGALSRRNDLIWNELMYSYRTNSEIAAIFNVSVRTVKKHILKKTRKGEKGRGK